MKKLIFFIPILSFLILFSVSQNALAATKKAKSNQQTLPLEDIQRFTTVINQIKNYYVEPVDDQQLFDNAIRGMLSGLDPHSTYLDVEEFQSLQASTSGEFGGLGIEVGTEDGYVKVVSPLDDTPAAKAGIKAGDLIIRIDDKPTKGMPLREAVNQMRGEKDTKVKITTFRNSDQKIRHFNLVRSVIKIKSIKTEELEDGYVYARVSHFQTPSALDLKTAITEQLEKNDNHIKGLVLDLRNNPGGLLDASIEVSDVFLDGGKLDYDDLIVFTKGRLMGSQIEAKANPGDILNGAPMVVLINEGSASASEIVAGALQDHNRAIVLGTKTFGKGSVQTILPLDHQRGIKLTTALYYTPAGRSIQAEGIEPDLKVEEVIVATSNPNEAEHIDYITEADLAGHLENGEAPSNTEANSNQEATHLLESDFQLYQALNLLKGLNTVHAKHS